MQPAIARIIDANLNRAREGLRVLEDYARFALDDAGISKALKTARHMLTAIERAWPAADRLAARDTPRDVGTRITARGESARTTTVDILTAAARRLTEALRVLEEYAKLDEPPTAAKIERLRYDTYEIEKQLVLRAARPRFDGVRLYVLITACYCRRDWLATARDAILGGADCLQLREKDLDSGELLDRARRLVDLCRKHNVLCIINDRPDIARLAGADGVHVGQTDLAVADARAVAGPTLLIGKSTHNPAQFRRALREGPDYLAIGPMVDTTTKPQKHVPGPAVLARLPRTSLPLVAIGGVSVDTVGPILDADAAAPGTRARPPIALAVCTAVIAARDPRAAARALRNRITRASRRRP